MHNRNFIFKCVNKKIALYLFCFFGNCNSRTLKISLPRVNTLIESKAFSFHAVNHWNKLPCDIRKRILNSN